MSKKPEEKNTVAVEEIAEHEEKNTVAIDEITVSSPVEDKAAEVRVSVYIPTNADDESGEKVDPFERVTINGEGTIIKRGERVEVTVPVFVQLRNKFPKL